MSESEASGAIQPSSGFRWREAAAYAGFNLPFLLALIGVGHLPQFLQPLAVGAVLFAAPGLAWTDWREGDAFSVLFRGLLLSVALAVIVWLCALAPPGPTSREAFILGLAIATNVGLWVGSARGWRAANPFSARPVRLLWVIAALFYVQTYVGAAHFVPPLEDQDMETQGTAYGLMHEGAPTMATNRSTLHFFAHPLLLHFWIGESALVSGDLDRLKHYHDGARALEGATRGIFAQWERDLALFERDPVLLPTRTPNLILSLLIVLPMGLIVCRLTGSAVAAAGAGALYATMPEVYVRHAYGGYMAITNFLLVAGAYFYLSAAGLLPAQALTGPRRPARAGFWSGFLAGWADQKAILMGFAAPAHAALRFVLGGGIRGLLARAWRQGPRDAAIGSAFLIGVGFVAGWLVFAAYGLAISPREFIDDHVMGHVARRLKMSDLNLSEVAQGAWTYPSILALWREFADHTGWLLMAALAPALYDAGRRVRDGEGMLLLWAAIGAIGFSLVDWRQTKHLAHILPAIAMLVMIYWTRLAGPWRMAFSIVLAAAGAWNAWRVGLQMRDFSYIQPFPIW